MLCNQQAFKTRLQKNITRLSLVHQHLKQVIIFVIVAAKSEQPPFSCVLSTAPANSLLILPGTRVVKHTLPNLLTVDYQTFLSTVL